MTLDVHHRLPIEDPSQAGEARRAAVTLAVRLGFDEPDAGRVGVVVTEAASNIVKHAGRGQLLLRAIDDAPDDACLELLALDRGPGMADVARCLRDGYSSAGSPGTGLGAISRLASVLEIYSAPGLGTALLARIRPRSAAPPHDGASFVAGAVRVAASGEDVCGDAWALAHSGPRTLVMVVDGLGHGLYAARAAEAAVAAFHANVALPIQGILEATHRALRPTRGAAASLAEIDLELRQVRYAGLGNVSGAIVWAGGARSMVGQNGTLGAEARTIRASTYPWADGASVVLHSDGLTSQTSPQAYPGLLARDPSLAAGVLYRDFARGRDDATVVVARARSDGR